MDQSSAQPMWVMVAGPYSSGSADAAQRATNLRTLNDAALALHHLGHVPVIGVNMALPVIGAAGGDDMTYWEVMMPLALADRCDACFRVGGASIGADDEVSRFKAQGCPVFRRLNEVPRATRP